MTWRADEDWSGREMMKILPWVVPYTRGKVLDVGSGQTRWFHHWTTLDSGMDYGGQRVSDVQGDAFGALPFQDGSWDALVTSHVIEHAPDWQAALTEWWRIIKADGHLVLYWPHPDHYPKVGQPGANPDHKVDLYPDMVLEHMATLGGWDLLEDETRSDGAEYSQFQVYRKRADDEQRMMPWRKPEKAALVIRYGAFGDQIVASAVLPHLKAEGYHITYNTVPHGHDVLKANPHIDAFIIQDVDQVDNEALGPYWQRMDERYDRVINLCSSVEEQLLARPGSIIDQYPDDVRRKVCGINYLERTADLAGVPHEFDGARFYPTDDEIELARQHLEQFEPPYYLWVIKGSSLHKIWPYVSQAMVRWLYTMPGTMFLAGDAKAAEIEGALDRVAKQYYGAANRLVRTSGDWPIRGTMTLAGMCDVVIGPETGVLNAVAMQEDVGKVVFLSHSSHENLTKHWKNTVGLASSAVPCYPCHRLHYDWSRCHKDAETGTAACQAAIPVEQFMMALHAVTQKQMERRADRDSEAPAEAAE